MFYMLTVIYEHILFLEISQSVPSTFLLSLRVAMFSARDFTQIFSHQLVTALYPAFCLQPDSEAIAKGLGRHIWPPPPFLHLAEFPEKVNDKWHGWHELTWMTWIDMNDLNWHEWHEFTWITWICMNAMNIIWHKWREWTCLDMILHECHELPWHNECAEIVSIPLTLQRQPKAQ
jgi:hypothetical protein